MSYTLRLFSSLTVASIALVASAVALGNTSATKVELPCSPSDRATIFSKAGRQNVKMSVTTNGIKVFGKDKLVTVIVTDNNFLEWSGQVSQEDLLAAQGVSVHIEAKCSSDALYTDMWPAGTTLNCRKGDGVEIRQYEPDCLTEPNNFGVLTLTETEDEEVITTNIPVVQNSTVPNLHSSASSSTLLLKSTGVIQTKSGGSSGCSCVIM